MRRALLCFTLIFLVGLAGYANSFHAGFHGDDLLGLVGNPEIRSLANFHPGGLIGLDDTGDWRAQRLVGWVTFALNYRLGGLQVEGYHAFNLAIHVLTAWVLCLLVAATWRAPAFAARSTIENRVRDGAALLAGLLFVAHPVQTQAVTYVIQRFTSLAALFYLSSILLYARWRLAAAAADSPPRRAWGFYAGALLMALLAMRTKEIAFTLPAAILLFEVFFFGAANRKRWRSIAPFILVALVIPLSMLRAGGGEQGILARAAEASRLQSSVPRPAYLLTQLTVVVRYLRLLVLPTGQNLDYDWPVYRSPLEPRVLAAAALLALLATGAWYLYRRRAAIPPELLWVPFGFAWFILTLSVESSVVPIDDVIFEHRVYLPSVGFFVAAAGTAALLARSVRARWQRSPAALAAGAALIVATLTGATHLRNRVWSDELSLWSDVVAKSPGRTRGMIFLARALKEKGDADGAGALYRKVAGIPATDAIGHYNRASACREIGNPVCALAEYDRAVALGMREVSLFINRGNALDDAGRPHDALADYERALAISPGNALVEYNMGLVYQRLGRLDIAAEHYRAACDVGSQPGCAALRAIAGPGHR